MCNISPKIIFFLTLLLCCTHVFSQSSSSYDTLFSFVTGSNTGIFPNCIPILGSDGKIYGTTERGGQNSTGVLYSFDPINNRFKNEHNFWEGKYPQGGIAQGKDGKIYGTTELGSTRPGEEDGYGTLYSFDPVTKKIKYLKFFSQNDSCGYQPRGGVVIASNGNIFGTTYTGADGFGTLFEYIPSQDTIIRRYKFTNGNGGGRNLSPLIQIDSLHLVGVTPYGGSNLSGCLYKYNIKTHKMHVVYSFANYNGFPQSNIMLAADGNYYGATFDQSIYKFDSIVTILKNFTSNYSPNSNLVQAGNGSIYGMSQWTGSTTYNPKGIIYKYDPDKNVYTDSVIVFSGKNGSLPKNGLIYYTPNETIYGTTYLGGSGGHGVFFRYKPAKDTLPKVEISADLRSLTSTTISLRGKISSNKIGKIILKGFCYSTNPNPSLSNSTCITVNTNNFQFELDILKPLTTYYVRAYAMNKSGTFYSEQIKFTTKQGLFVSKPGYIGSNQFSITATLIDTWSTNYQNYLVVSTKKDFSNAQIFETSDINFNDTITASFVADVEAGTKYYYYVKAIYNWNYEWAKSAVDSLTTVTTGFKGPAGGIVVFDKGFKSDGWQYIESVPLDSAKLLPFGCNNVGIVYGEPCDASLGSKNTFDLVTQCGTNTPNAAMYCDNLNYGGKNDWFLSSSWVLRYINRNIRTLNQTYWTSCTFTNYYGIFYRNGMGFNDRDYTTRTSKLLVLPVRVY